MPVKRAKMLARAAILDFEASWFVLLAGALVAVISVLLGRASVDIFRDVWMVLTLIGALRAFINANRATTHWNRLTDNDKDEVLKTRAFFTAIDAYLVFGMLFFAFLASVFSVFGNTFGALTCLIVMALLMIWLTFNWAKGEEAVEQMIRELLESDVDTA